MSEGVIGVVVVMVAGVFNAAFALPMRYNRIWKWENTWLVFCAWSLGVFPWLLDGVLVKHLNELLASLSFRDVVPALLCGFLFGIAQAAFGVALRLVGVSIALPVVSVLAIMVGAFTPVLVRHPGILLGRQGLIMGLSMLFLVGGLILYWHAARLREGTSGSRRSFRGLSLAIFTGILGGTINVGFALSDEMVHRSRMLGNSASVSTYPVWAVLLAAAFVPNLIYCSYLIWRDHTGKLFMSADTWADFARSTLMAVLWILATTLYGMSTTFLGEFGASAGYLFYGCFTIFFANVLGWKAGEWVGAPSPALRRFWAAMGLVLASVVILGLTV